MRYDMRWIQITLLFAVLLCLGTGCQREEQSIASTNESDFETGISDTFSVPISDPSNLLNGDITGYIYFSRESCPICLVFNAYMDVCLTENYSPIIYKFDTDMWREDEEFQTGLDRYDIDAIPALIKIYESGEFEMFQSTAETHEDFITDLSSFLNK